MIILLENPYLIVVLGALVAAILVVALVQTGRPGFLYGAIATAAVTAGMLVLEWVVVTDREQVEATLGGLAAALETNSVSAVLAYIAPDAASMRSAAESRLPGVVIKDARVGGDLDVTVDRAASPATATAKFTGRVIGSDRSGFVSEGTYAARFTVYLRETPSGWKLYDYEERPLIGRGGKKD